MKSMMSKRCWPSCTISPTMPLIWSKTPIPARIVHSTKTMTTPAMPRATESRNDDLHRRPRVDPRDREPHAAGGCRARRLAAAAAARPRRPRRRWSWPSAGWRPARREQHAGDGGGPPSGSGRRGRGSTGPPAPDADPSAIRRSALPSPARPAVGPPSAWDTPAGRRGEAGGPTGRPASSAVLTHGLLSPRRPPTVRHRSPRLRHLTRRAAQTETSSSPRRRRMPSGRLLAASTLQPPRPRARG